MKAVAAYKLHGEKDDSIHAHRYIICCRWVMR